MFARAPGTVKYHHKGRQENRLPAEPKKMHSVFISWIVCCSLPELSHEGGPGEANTNVPPYIDRFYNIRSHRKFNVALYPVAL